MAEQDAAYWEYKWTPESIESFWNMLAQSPLEQLSFSRLFGPSLVKVIEKYVPKDRTICDFGAGGGDLVKLLLDAGYSVGAFEPAEKRRRNFPEEIFKNPRFLGFDDDRVYDCVTCVEALEHLTAENAAEAMKAAAGALKEGGLFIGSVPWNERLWAQYAICPNCRAAFHRWQHIRSFTPETLAEFLTAHGFKPREIFRADFAPSAIFISVKPHSQTDGASTNEKKLDARMMGILRKAPIDAGPCRISPERFRYLCKLKYERDLTKREMEDHLAYQFYHAFGYNLDLDDPRTFNEKANWLKINYRNPLIRQCADKATFHSFVKSRLPGLADHLVRPLAILHSPEEMTETLLSSFPDRFVLKSNFGSGAQMFVDRANANPAELKAFISRWLNPRMSHYYYALEFGYKDLPPAVIVEPIVDFDCKIEFYCFDGEPFMYWVVINDKTKDVRANFYRMNGEKLELAWNYKNFVGDYPQPSYFDAIATAARTLSAGFPHARVDFYAGKNDWRFSEMTFYTWAGLSPLSSFEFDVALGRALDLSKIDKCE